MSDSLKMRLRQFRLSGLEKALNARFKEVSVSRDARLEALLSLGTVFEEHENLLLTEEGARLFGPKLTQLLRELNDQYGLHISWEVFMSAFLISSWWTTTKFHQEFVRARRSVNFNSVYTAQRALMVSEFSENVWGPHSGIGTGMVRYLTHTGAIRLLESVITPQVEAGDRKCQVLPAGVGGDYTQCPILMPAALVRPERLIQGVVLPFGKKRYRVRFDWKALTSKGDDGYWITHFPGLDAYPISFEETTDPITKAEHKRWNLHNNYMWLGGLGSSQQADAAPAFKGRLPACIATWQAGSDYTWCLMVSLDENQEPEVCWLLGTNT